MTGRHTKILEIVNRAGRIDVNSLAEQVGVSAVTIRKDLDTLAAEKLLSREHGFAISGSTEDINNRLAVQYDGLAGGDRDDRVGFHLRSAGQ